MIQTITWTGSSVRLLDQTKLPTETVYVDITDEKQMWDAIKRLVVRGAPAIGVAAAFGVYLGVHGFPEFAGDISNFHRQLDEVGSYLKSSRPTAVNLAWAVDRVLKHARNLPRSNATTAQLIGIIKQQVLDESLKMLEEDTAICRALGEHGLGLLRERAELKSVGALNILTHCNAGGLATVQYGTALAPVYVAAERGMKVHVWADETRPLLQGSRITAYELQQNGIPVTVICDGMAASVMSQGKVDAVIVGTDRVAANGDVANKIGTLGVAILAKHYRIPFYVAAPTSSIDLSLPDGSHIPIEERDPAEITRGMGKQTAPDGVEVYNPAFDVTPADLVTAIITENGVARPPYHKSLSFTVPRRT